MSAAAVSRPVQTIHPQQPFSFPQSLAFLGRFPPTLGERVILNGAVLGAARLDGQTVGYRVCADEENGAPALRCEFHAARPVSDVTTEALTRRIEGWLGAADDLRPFYALAEADSPFMRVVRHLYGYHQVRFFTPFENTCWAILGQRTPMALARAAKRGLMTRYAGTATVDGQTFLAFPEPADLAAATVEELTEIVGSARKAERLHRIAQAFAETGADALDAMPTHALAMWLQQLPGVGPWSGTFITLRGFGRPDAPLRLGAAASFDRELLNAARAVYGPDLTETGMAQIIERYAGWQGYWGHYLRVAG